MPAPVANLVRVAVAAAIGAVVTMFAKWGIHLPAGWTAAIGVAITGLVAGFYHQGVTWLEARFPWLKILLGNVASPKPPAARVKL